MLRTSLFLGFVATVNAERGLLELDNTTLYRIAGGATAMMVRVNKEYSYGDEDDAWKEFGKVVGDSDANALIGNVGVADAPSPPSRGEYSEGEYGEGGPPADDEDFDPNGWRDNQDIAERFSISLEAFPQYLFFPAGWKEGDAPVKYEGEQTKDGFLRFLQDKANVWIGLPGQVKSLHLCGQTFATASADERKKCIATAQTFTDEAGKYYAKVMAKIDANADFAAKEVARLTKMLDDGSVAANKKAQFGKRLNALSSFTQ